MAGGVFISYRREDSAGFAGRIYDRLVSRLESGRVFFDVDNIEPGLDFVKVLADRVGDCDALVAIIGEQWLSARDEENQRRLDDPHDFVRIEIEAALQRDVRVIPVLINGARMPRATDLPEALKGLARRQAIEISHTRFDTDSERLTRALQRALDAPRALPPEQGANAANGPATQAASVVAEIPPPAAPSEPVSSPKPKQDSGAIDPEGVTRQPATPAPRAVGVATKPFPIKAITPIVLGVIAIIGFVFLRTTINHEPPLNPIVAAAQLTVSEAPGFAGPQGGPFIPSQAIFSLKAAGPGFDWTVADELPNWLILTPTRGRIADNGATDVTATLAPGAQSLSPGRYESQITFKNLASGLTVARTERLIISERPQITPGRLIVFEAPDFVGPQGGPFGPPQATLNLKAIGPGFDWSVDNPLPSWLVVAPMKGHLADNGFTDVTLTLAPSALSLSPGEYGSEITFKNLASGLTETRTEHLVVSARPQEYGGFPNFVERIMPPMPVTFGDDYAKVKAAYNTSKAPKPFMSAGKQEGTQLWLQDRGIAFFFDDAGKIDTIRLDAPFAGSVAGVKIGDARNEVEKTLGKPSKSEFQGVWLHYGPKFQLECNLLTGIVETIFLYR